MVNLAVRTLLYGPLKFKVGFVAKLFCDLSPSVLNFYSKEKFKTVFTLNGALKRASDLIFKLIRFTFEVRQKFEAVPRGQKSFLSRQTHGRDIINILLTSFSRSVL